MSGYLLAIDQGTTSTRAVIYDPTGHVCGSASRELTQHYPQPGWVEHDANEIWSSVCDVVPHALAQANIDTKQIAAIGVTNQRETVVVWDRENLSPLAKAIVWQDRRTTDFCRQRARDQDWLQRRTGLVLDPYFSATKLRWLLDANPEWRGRAERGEIACGTIDSFLIAKLTNGTRHVTDVTNASRTLLFDLTKLQWDDELCRYFDVPRRWLPEVLPSAAAFGETRGLGFLPDGIPIGGVAGDQQAALFGQCAFTPGEAKCTYGTGAFLLMHTGSTPVMSRNRLLTTVAAMTDSTPQYALEGSVFIAGAAIQWLRDGLNLFASNAESETLAAKANPDEQLIFVPGFVGLGAPYWIPEARGVLFGLTRGTSRAELARAALEGVAFQVADLIDAATQDLGSALKGLRVDGGMARNDWFLQCQADVLGLPVFAAPNSESTALGAAFLAGLHVGVWPNAESLRKLLTDARPFAPKCDSAERERRLRRWRRAVRAVIGFYVE